MADFSIRDALDTLVNQFAEPKAFFRELIQNAIDAGSPEIDVWVRYEKDEAGGDGMMTVHVDDYGEGMDRAIIDTRLTRLFSSGKDGDFTKIGRFGIGFVSVFAIEPDAVCLDTSRGGESWRVLFHADRSFERIVLDTPVDGTKIRIFKKLPEAEFRAFEARSKEVVSHWCKHARAEVRFQDEPINEKFVVKGLCPVRFEEEGTEAVAAFVEDGEGSHGFYNRGLTLWEGANTGPTSDFPAHVAFKVNSRYLEHTLTRDNVLRDTNFDKAMGIIDRLVREQLPEQLFSALAQRPPDANPHYRALTDWLGAERAHTGDELPSALKKRRDHVAFFTPSGEPMTIRQCLDAGNKLLYDPEHSELIARLCQEGWSVVGVHRSSAGYGALSRVVGFSPRRANASFATAILPRGREPEAYEPLRRAVAELLRDYGAKVKAVHLAHMRYPGSQVASRVVMTQSEVGAVTPAEEIDELGKGFFSSKRDVVINADHDTVKKLLQLAPREPELAAYLTTKLFFLRSELTPEIDSVLAAHAVDRRCQRLSA